jgi:protein SCO1/2
MKHALSIALLFLAWSTLADGSYPSTSIYRLEAALENQSGVQHGLDVYEGHPVLVTMFYSSCGHTCPLLIETMRAVERAASDAKHLRVLLISFDPERDTPAALANLAKERRIDTSRWTLARGDAATVRKVAAVLNVQYKQLPDGEFNHSNVISVLTPNGEIAAQSSTLGKADEALLSALAARP